MPIQRREWSIFNTQTIDKIASSITDYDNGLNQLKVFNRLTKNGTVQTIQMDDNGNLYVNATWVSTGILADKTAKNAWNLDTGDLAMTKGSISLGALTGGGYNFSVTDAGALTMKSGSITLGTSGQKPYFHVATTGALEWDLTNSSMTSTGVMTLNGATITGGSLTTQSGDRKAVVTAGSMDFYYNNTLAGTISSSNPPSLGGPGPFITISDASAGGGFMIENPPGSSNVRQLAFWYDRNNDVWQIDRGFIINCPTEIDDDVDVYGTLTVNNATVATQSWVSTNTPGKGISQTVYIKNPANNRNYELVFTGGTLQSYTAL